MISFKRILWVGSMVFGLFFTNFVVAKPLYIISAGGADGYCESFGEPTGCDANWTAVAQQIDEEGNAIGIAQDSFSNNTGFHANIDCVRVSEDGKYALLNGVLQDTPNHLLGGYRLSVVVADDDPEFGDMVSFSFVEPPDRDCDGVLAIRGSMEELVDFLKNYPAYPLIFPIENGNVKIMKK